MRMLIDQPRFDHFASVPWPYLNQDQLDWEIGVKVIETWLQNRVGPRLAHWAWADSYSSYQIGVSFQWERDKLLFVIAWS
jgi:hypothetical protein